METLIMLFETKKLTPNMTAICVNTARAKGYPSFEAMVHHYPANNARHGVEVAQIKGQLREYNNGGGYITELVVKIRLAKSELTAKRLSAVLDDADKVLQETHDEYWENAIADFESGEMPHRPLPYAVWVRENGDAVLAEARDDWRDDIE
jgi:hypothetical protein